jgi:DNA-binding MarR family transcriptional regulator
MPATTRDLDLSRYAEVAETCTAALLRRASRAVTNAFDAAMRPAGLRNSQFSVLVALALARQAPISKLARILGLDRTTMTRNLAPLERRGLAVSVAGEDRRNKVFQLTARGQAALARALPAWQAAQASVVSELGQSRWTALQRGLKAAATARPAGRSGSRS